MAFTENLKVEIESIFDGEGFSKMRAALKKTRAEAAKTEAKLESIGGRGGGPLGGVATGRGAGFFEEKDERGMGIRRTGFDADPMEAVKGMEVPDIADGFPRMEGQSNILSRSLFRLGKAANLSGQNMNRLGFATAKASSGFGILSAMASRAGDSLRGVSINAQQVQMRLLGLQFQLLSLAFIFGGLMMSAMSAVGIFKILGNTLKMFFLPTALELLPVMLDIRDAVLGVGEDTKKQVGKIFLLIAVLATLGSLSAFILNGFIAVASALWTLSAPIRFIVRWFTKGGRILANLGRTFLSVASFLYGLVAGFLGAMKIFEIFGDVVGLIINVFLALIGVIVLVTGFITLPFWAAAAVAGAVIGIIIAIIVKFKDSIISILSGIVGWIMKWGGKLLNFLLWPFKKAYEMIVGNSIIPDLVNDVVDWFFKLPGMVAGLGVKLVKTIVNGITSMAGAIWSAFKKIMPDFLVNAIEGAGKAVGSAVGAVGDFASSGFNAVKNFVTGGSDKASKTAKPKKENKGGETKVQNNSINAQVEVNDKEETPQETGREFGRGVNDSLNNRQNDYAGGT